MKKKNKVYSQGGDNSNDNVLLSSYLCTVFALQKHAVIIVTKKLFKENEVAGFVVAFLIFLAPVGGNH